VARREGDLLNVVLGRKAQPSSLTRPRPGIGFDGEIEQRQCSPSVQLKLVKSISASRRVGWRTTAKVGSCPGWLFTISTIGNPPFFSTNERNQSVSLGL
jgi:hypothetical protein